MAATRKMAKVKSTASHSPEALRKTCLGASRRNSTEKALLGSTRKFLMERGWETAEIGMVNVGKELTTHNRQNWGVGKTSCSEQRVTHTMWVLSGFLLRTKVWLSIYVPSTCTGSKKWRVLNASKHEPLCWVPPCCQVASWWGLLCYQTG